MTSPKERIFAPGAKSTKHNIWYYTTRGDIPQVVFDGKREGKKNFSLRQIPADFTPPSHYTMRQRATAAAPILHRPSAFAVDFRLPVPVAGDPFPGIYGCDMR